MYILSCVFYSYKIEWRDDFLYTGWSIPAEKRSEQKMRIAICDDESAFRDELKEMVFRYKAEHNLHMDVYIFENGEALLADPSPFDMIFLDYQMPGSDGMEVARQLRGRSCMCSIVFITAYPSFVFEAFEVQPYRFFVKPVTQTDIDSLLTAFISQQRKLAPLIVINEGERSVVQAKDVLYLEGAGKYCTVRTTRKTYSSSKTLAQVHELLPQHCFYRSHKSYVVNLYSIQSLENGAIILTNGEAVQIGRNKLAEFKRIYKQFVKEYYLTI